MNKLNYYEFFGLPAFESDPAKIKQAYRSMALKWHPDRNTDKAQSEHMMKQVNEVWRILSRHKASYDAHLNHKLRNNPFDYTKTYGWSFYDRHQEEPFDTKKYKEYQSSQEYGNSAKGSAKSTRQQEWYDDPEDIAKHGKDPMDADIECVWDDILHKFRYRKVKRTKSKTRSKGCEEVIDPPSSRGKG